jgi:hypothetical protein
VEKVLEKLETTESTTLAVKRVGGKIRVASMLWESPKAILRGEVLEARDVDGPLHIAHKARHPDEWDLPVEAYDPYGPGDEFIAD